MRTSRLQYALLLLVALGSLICYFSSASATLYEVYSDHAPRLPLSFGYSLNAVSGNTTEAYEAGIRWGDPVLAINGRPFTGYTVLLEEVHKTGAGNALQVTFVPKAGALDRTRQDPGNVNTAGHRDLIQDGPPQTVTVMLQAANPQRPTFIHLVTEFFFLALLFPLSCLLLAFWVVASKPRDWNAWFMLGILTYFAAIFTSSHHWYGGLLAFTGVWNQMQETIGPLSIMLFGIYFPERANFDRSLPWIKWLMIAAVLAFLPPNLAWTLGFYFNFASIAWLSPIVVKIAPAETIVFMAAISLYFFGLGKKLSSATRPDVRRRLQILYWGSTVGNGPFFLVVIYSLVRGRDLGDGVPPWLLVTLLLIFTLFPLSLAYVVVVHRAMELRILVRQGSKYALARGGVWLVRALLGLGVGLSLVQMQRHHPVRLADQLLALGLVAIFLLFRLSAAKKLSLWIDRKFFRETYSSEQVLAELATQVQTFTESQPLLQTVSDCISKALHVERIAVLLRTGDVFHLELTTGMASTIEGRPGMTFSATSETISSLSRSRSAAVIYQDSPEDWLLAAGDSERHALAELGAELLIPLPGRNRLIGVLALGPKRSEEPYSRSDRNLLQSVALHTGLSLENGELIRSLALEAVQREKLNREMEIAREVQERMFPQSLPLVAGVDFAGHCRPALGIGGDYYDFFELKERGGGVRPLGLAIGDVSGKGISAALLMASLRASLRSMTRTSSDDLAAIIGEVNELVYEASASNRYATFFYAQYDPETRILSYVNAGHNAPILFRPSAPDHEQILRLEACGPVVGLLPAAEYDRCDLLVQSGDILLTYTDGISESMALDEEEWGEERMIECLCQNAALPAASLLEKLLDGATGFAGAAPQFDDMTLLVVKFGAV